MPASLTTQPELRLRDRVRGRNRPEPVRHGQLQRRGPLGFVLKLIAAVTGVVVVSTLGVAAYAVVDTVSTIKPGIHLVAAPGRTAAPLQAVPLIGPMPGPVNVLLTGSDTRTGQGGQFANRADQQASSGAGNNDVTMVLHIAADHKSAVVVSIPRDLLVTIPQCPTPDGTGTRSAASMQMFNTTLSRGGVSCTVLTAEKLTGLDIPYAAEISFDGVINMSNAVGGVPVCLATPLTDPYVGLKLAAGQQTLVGADALAFVRSRHGVGDGSDLGRISNQQLFLSALMRKVTSAGVLGNPVQLYALARAAVSSMQLSDTLTQPSTMVAIGLALKGMDLSKVVFLQYPAGSDPDYPGRVVPIASSAKALIHALSTDQPVQLTGSVGRAAEAATPAPTPTPAAPPATTSGPPLTAAPGATPSPTAVALPENITGQTAAQQTCTKGN